jgi:Transposase
MVGPADLQNAGCAASTKQAAQSRMQEADRIKTDRRDAVRLARFLRSGDLTEVQVPDAATEAMRDLERAREESKDSQRAARHQLTNCLLPHERKYSGKMSWTGMPETRQRLTAPKTEAPAPTGVPSALTRRTNPREPERRFAPIGHAAQVIAWTAQSLAAGFDGAEVPVFLGYRLPTAAAATERLKEAARKTRARKHLRNPSGTQLDR